MFYSSPRLSDLPLDGETVPHLTHHDYIECLRMIVERWDAGDECGAMQLANLVHRASKLRERQYAEGALAPTL